MYCIKRLCYTDGNGVVVFSLLLKRGADVHLANHKQQTPLHLAVLNSCQEQVLALLLSYGADVNANDLEVSYSPPLASP